MHRYLAALAIALVALPSNAMLLLWFFIAAPFAVMAEKQNCEEMRQKLATEDADEATLIEYVLGCSDDKDD